MPGSLRRRPADEDDWTALRHALDVLIEPYRNDLAGVLATTRLIMDTPALCSRQRDQQHKWCPVLAQALAERGESPRPVTLAMSVRAVAAVDCLGIAIDHWTASDGALDLVELLDETFAALAPRR